LDGLHDPIFQGVGKWVIGAKEGRNLHEGTQEELIVPLQTWVCNIMRDGVWTCEAQHSTRIHELATHKHNADSLSGISPDAKLCLGQGFTYHDTITKRPLLQGSYRRGRGRTRRRDRVEANL
jgi:hypothetical protein